MAAPKPKIPKKDEINKPSQPLKSFFWDKIKDNELKPEVIWGEIGRSDIRLDDHYVKKLEQIFCQKISEKVEKVEEQQKATLISTLDGKRQQAIGIAM